MSELTKENYRTNHDYMSYSTFSKYLQCEAAAKARYKEPASTAQLVGSYVDAYFSEELESFKQEHPEIFNTKTGALKSDFIKADALIERIKSDEMFMKCLSGEKQAIMSGVIDGMKFKIKMDSYYPNEAIYDLKVLKDFARVWSDSYGRYVNFVEAYNYDIEMAIFQEIVYQNTGKKLPCFLACITKEEPSDVAILNIPQQTLDIALQIVKNNIPRIRQIMNNEIAPFRCNKCAYCRLTKKASIISYDMVGLHGDKLREEGYIVEDPINKEKPKEE